MSQKHFNSDCNCSVLVLIKKNYVILSQSVEVLLYLYIGYTVARLSRFRL